MDKAYLYADESGNTGNAIFDYPEYFMNAGIFSVSDIEVDAAKLVDARCNEIGEKRLHACNLPAEVNLQNARLFLSFLKDKQWKFFVSILHKPYLSSIVLFDIFFDPVNNPAVPNHLYTLEPLRHLILGKLDHALSFEDGKDNPNSKLKRRFWEAFNKSNREEMERVISDIAAQVEALIPDKASKKIIGDALTYACAYLKKEERFGLKAYTQAKWHKPYTPNMHGFSIINNEMHNFCEKYGVVPGTFYHDQQTEFSRSMKFFHENMALFHVETEKPLMVTQAKEVTYSPSDFAMHASDNIKMLQIVDCFLWIFQKDDFDEALKKEFFNEIEFIQTQTSWHETSLRMSEEILLAWDMKIPQSFSPERMAKGKALLDELYKRQEQKLANAEKQFAQDVAPNEALAARRVSKR